jgi:hypothetical protein
MRIAKIIIAIPFVMAASSALMILSYLLVPMMIVGAVFSILYFASSEL